MVEEVTCDRPAAGGEERQPSGQVDCAADVGTMHADLTKVRQSLFNLLATPASSPTRARSRWTVERQRRTARLGRASRQRHRHRHDAGADRRLFQAFTQAEPRPRASTAARAWAWRSPGGSAR